MNLCQPIVRKVGSSDEILPMLWEDNYISLLPRESRVINAKYIDKGVLATGVNGWNIEPITIPVRIHSEMVGDSGNRYGD